MRKKNLWRPLAAVSLLAFSGFAALILAASPQSHPIGVKITAALFAVGVVWCGFEIFLRHQNDLRYIATMNRRLESSDQSVPQHMMMPIAILNRDMQFIWYNDSFEEAIASGVDFFGKDLADMLPTLPKQLAEHDTAEVTVNDHTYHVFQSDYVRSGGKTHMLCFQDISDYVKLRHHFWDTRICVLSIVIDNYEDTMSAVKPSERSAVLAELEALFDRQFDGTDCIFARLEDDKFLVLVESQYYIAMEHAKFPILDEVRKIVVGGKNAMTLSIGVGRGGTTLSQNEIFAQQSLDMALGRGGDQAAVKTKSGYNFYGGVSKGVEKKSKTRHRAVAKAMRELLESCDRVFIMGHRLSDLDAVGAAIGTAFIAGSLGKQFRIILNPKATLAGPLVEQLITEHPDWLISPEAAASAIEQDDLLIVVDTFSKDILEAPAVYQAANHVMVIDHHRKMVNYLDNTTLLFHEPYASSASELVTGLIQFLDFRENLPRFCAEALLAGIMLDTKNFVMQTGVQTFEAAAFLRTQGADPVTVKALFAASMTAYRHRSLLVSDAELHGRFAITVAREAVPDMQVIAAQTADDLLGIEGVDASFVIFPNDSLACISARSLGKMNVQVIMEMLGGGGHQTMAAAQVKNCTPTALRIRLIETLDSLETADSAASDET